MNIALFVDTYEPQINGVVTVVKQLKSDLEALSCSVYIITPRRNNSRELDGVFYLKARPSRIAKNEYVVTEKYQPVLEFCLEKKIDILHVHSEFGVAFIAIKIAKKLNLPLCMTFHTFWKHYIRAYVPLGFLVPQKIVDVYTKYIYKNADIVFAVSQKVKDYLGSSKMLANQKLILVENAIDRSTIFTRQALEHSEKNILDIKNKYHIEQGDFVLLYFGRVSPEKRLKELLKIFASVAKKSDKAMKFLVLGDGPAKEDLIALSKKLKIDKKAFFLGFIERENLIDYFTLSNLFVSASISETYSMTVTEALSAGLPVLLREDSCYFDRVENGKNGIMSKSDADLEKALLDLVSNPEKLAFLKSNCKREERSISSMDQAKKYLSAYQELLRDWNKQAIVE